MKGSARTRVQVLAIQQKNGNADDKYDKYDESAAIVTAYGSRLVIKFIIGYQHGGLTDSCSSRAM